MFFFISKVGIEYDTFQDAAKLLNFTRQADEGIKVFEEVMMFSSIRQRRATFCVLTLQGYTTKCIYDNLVLRRSMYVETAGMSEEELNEELLEDLQNRISVGGRSLAVYGLPSPLTKKNEVEYYRMKFPRRESLRYYNELTVKYPLNQEQEDVYNQIITTVMGQSKDDERKMFFLNANAGICLIYIHVW